MRPCYALTIASAVGHVVPRGNFPNGQHYLFETVRGEANALELPITSGAFPEWLDGSKYNNGFGQFEMNTKKGVKQINHLADGLSYYTKFQIQNGSVRLWNKLQKTEYWKDTWQEIPKFRTFNGTTPDFDDISWVEASVHWDPPTPDNLNVGIIQMTSNSERMFGNSDMPGFNEADEDLNYLGALNFKDKHHLEHGVAAFFTATHIGNTLGDHYTYGFQIGARPNVKHALQMGVYRIDMDQADDGPGATLEREWLAHTPLPALMDISYQHALANTKNYLVFVLTPFRIDVEKMIPHTRILKAMHYAENATNTLMVFDKRTNTFVKTFTSNDYWFYHYVNCHEDGDNIVLDFNSVDWLHITTAFGIEHLRNDDPWEFEAKATLRLTIDMTADDGTHFTTEEIGPSYDLATIHPNLHGQKYRWAWGLGWTGEHLWYDTLLKHDVINRQVTKSVKLPDSYPGEFNAVAKPGATCEDDVILLTVMLKGLEGTSYLMAFDGRDLSQIAEAKAPYALPFGSHGCWQPTGGRMGCTGETTADPHGEPAEFSCDEEGRALV